MGHVVVERNLNHTEVTYKIIVAGKNFALPLSMPVTVAFQGKSYSAKTHSVTVGRVGGLAALYSDFPLKEGDRIRLDYDPDANTIYIETGAASSVHTETPAIREQDAPSAGDASRAAPEPLASEKPKRVQSEPYIFISYNKDDKNWVFPVLDELRRHGYRYWCDQRIAPSSDWTLEINRRLDGCSAFFAFLSKSYANSAFCLAESNLAFETKKQIQPIYLENPEASDPEEFKFRLDPRLRLNQFLMKTKHDTPNEFANYLVRQLEQWPEFEVFKKK